MKLKPEKRIAKEFFYLKKIETDELGVPKLAVKRINIPEHFQMQASDVNKSVRQMILDLGELL